MSTKPEVWQRGPVADIPALLQPVAHALLQAREELEELLPEISESILWKRPAGVASPAFHLQHLSGVLDRVFSYARAAALTEEQFKQLRDEDVPGLPEINAENLFQRFDTQVEKALAQLKTTNINTLTDFRGVGRQQLPSTVIGLLVHAAEHTMRHLGQLRVTVKLLNAFPGS
jgi:uncharacterized damage-inducible protein DinB